MLHPHWRAAETGGANQPSSDSKAELSPAQNRYAYAPTAGFRIKTVQEIAKEYEVHPAQVSEWKRTGLDGFSKVFERGADKATSEAEAERDREQLLAKIVSVVLVVEKPDGLNVG